MRWFDRLLLYSVTVLACWGCVSTSYRFGRFHPQQPNGVSPQAVVVDYGRPLKTLDQIGWVVGLPGRILTFKWETNNHYISPETIEKLRTYLEENDITDVYVGVNNYDPRGQWRRLRENDRIAPVWRYSFGTLGWLVYTVIPHRVFGGDDYDPFTNSLNLTSDVPALALVESAYAKDIHSRELPGVYASINDLPLLSLWRHSLAISDVVGYARQHDDWEVEQDVYHVVYPHVGWTAMGPVGHFVPVVGPFLNVGGAVVGHATGRTVAALVERQTIQPSPARDLLPALAVEGVAAKQPRPGFVKPLLPDDDTVVHAGYQE